jgi:hypothetical protein
MYRAVRSAPRGVIVPEEALRGGLGMDFALPGSPCYRESGRLTSFHFNVSAKKAFIASQDRRSARSL